MELSDDDQVLMDEAAAAVVKRRLAVPAMMFLETVSPMNMLSSSMLHMITPIWGIALPAARLQQVAKLLERRGTIPELIRTIDEAEDQRRTEERAQRKARKEQRHAEALQKKQDKMRRKQQLKQPGKEP
jgi:hypothetical protein